jgi:CheY-like chemotaxis protein
MAKRSEERREEVSDEKDSAKTVLVAEGLSDTRMFMRMALGGHGYRVVEASTGEEAVEVARRERPDLILLDLHLQAPGGLEAARRIREEAGLEDVPIVATSTSESPELEAEALAAGCDLFRRQPIDFEKFGEIADLLLRPRARVRGEK